MQRSVYGTVDEVKKKTGHKDLFMGLWMKLHIGMVTMCQIFHVKNSWVKNCGSYATLIIVYA